jgi:epoxide hydrolase 4
MLVMKSIRKVVLADQCRLNTTGDKDLQGGSMRPFATETRIILTNGIRLHVQTAGPEDGPLVLLLHGFPEFWYGWRNQIPSLARSGYFVVAPDQRGYNLSDRPNNLASYDIDNLSQDVIGLIDHFGREKAAIVGHDWGAAVAWHTAIHHPERVEKLAILNVPNPAAHARAFRTLIPRQLMRSWYIFFFQIPRLPEFLLRRRRAAAMRKMLTSTSKPGSFSEDDLVRYTEAWLRRPQNPNQTGAVTGMLNWYRAAARTVFRKKPDGYQRGSRSRVTVPTLILWGERDVALIPELAQWSLEGCDNGRLVRFPDATHWIQHDEPERVNNLLLDFLKDSDR